MKPPLRWAGLAAALCAGLGAGGAAPGALQPTTPALARTGSAAAPFILFATSRFSSPSEQTAIVALLRRYVEAGDYLSLALAKSDPVLGARVPRIQRFVLPTNLPGVGSYAAKGCGDDTPGLIFYDGEHWAETPGEEQAAPNSAAAKAAKLVAATGCHKFGIAPDGRFAGVMPDTCKFDLDASILKKLDLTGIDQVNIQAQALLSNRCNRSDGLKSYVAFVTAIARDIRARAPATKISAQVTFRHTAPARMSAAIAQLTGVVDGFYLAYPQTIGPRCVYCEPRYLETVLRALRGSR